MPELPRYTPIATPQNMIFDANGIHVGYTVAVTLQKGAVQHTESVDVIIGEAAAAQLIADGMAAFTAWNKSQVEAHDLVAKANAALDAV